MQIIVIPHSPNPKMRYLPQCSLTSRTKYPNLSHNSGKIDAREHLQLPFGITVITVEYGEIPQMYGVRKFAPNLFFNDSIHTAQKAARSQPALS